MDSDAMVNSRDLIWLLEKAMKKNGWGSGKFLIDGFPKNIENVQDWERLMAFRSELIGVLEFSLDNEGMREGLMQKGYSEKIIDKRVWYYENKTIDALDSLAEGKMGVKQVNCSGGETENMERASEVVGVLVKDWRKKFTGDVAYLVNLERWNSPVKPAGKKNF
jgi:adenylate kinase family enzyme